MDSLWSKSFSNEILHKSVIHLANEGERRHRPIPKVNKAGVQDLADGSAHAVPCRGSPTARAD